MMFQARSMGYPLCEGSMEPQLGKGRMAELEHIASSAAEALIGDALAGLGCERFGIILARGAKSWGA